MCLRYRRLRAGICGRHYPWVPLQIYVCVEGVLGSEPGTLCTVTKHSTTNLHLKPSGVSVQYTTLALAVAVPLVQGSRNGSGGSFFVALKVASVHRAVQASLVWNSAAGVGGLDPLVSFLRGSVPSAKGSVGGNGTNTLLLWFSGKSDLTVDAVKLHNELQSGTLSLGKSQAPETTMDQDPEVAFTEKSSGTFLSGLSDCTNVTFSKVQRFWESNSAAHKEVGDWLLEFVGQWAGHIHDFLRALVTAVGISG